MAHVLSVTNTNSWAKAGVMVRDSAAANSAFVDVVVTPGSGVSFQWRSATGGGTSSTTVSGITGDVWVKLARQGNVFSAYYSSDGVNWKQIGTSRTIAMTSNALGGLAVSSHNIKSLCTATFGNVAIYSARAGAAVTGNPLTGLDRFGQVIGQTWLNVRTGEIADRVGYAYDRDGNRTARSNAVNSSFSESYAYDALNRLTDTQRGGSSYQSWDLDAVGNADTVTTQGNAEERTTNSQNELTQVGSATQNFDANGNTTTDSGGKTFVYDAWNRLVEVKNGGTSLVRYGIDAVGRRVVDGSADVYYSVAGQRIEDRVGGQARAQYVWSPVYVNCMIERDRDTNADGTLDERVYVTQDANFNVTAIVSPAGTVLERFVYDAYGKRTVLSASWQAATEGYAFLQGFQGGSADPVSGKIHFGARDYDPEAMRWLQQDPNPAGQYRGGMSLYQMVMSNPANGADPLGLDRYVTGSYGHQGIAVDTWALVKGRFVKTGVAQYDFAADYRFGPLLLGAWLGVPGRVSGPAPGFTSPVIETILSSPFEDMSLQGELNAAVINPPIYNIAIHNCRTFAQEHKGDGMASSTAPIPFVPPPLPPSAPWVGPVGPWGP